MSISFALNKRGKVSLERLNALEVLIKTILVRFLAHLN